MTLIAFDFDGTLSESEMTVLLGERCGVAEAMAEITERAMNGALSYAESLRKRAALLAGLPEIDVVAAYDRVELRKGAAAVIDELNSAGAAIAAHRRVRARRQSRARARERRRRPHRREPAPAPRW